MTSVDSPCIVVELGGCMSQLQVMPLEWVPRTWCRKLTMRIFNPDLSHLNTPPVTVLYCIVHGVEGKSQAL